VRRPGSAILESHYKKAECSKTVTNQMTFIVRVSFSCMLNLNVGKLLLRNYESGENSLDYSLPISQPYESFLDSVLYQKSVIH